MDSDIISINPYVKQFENALVAEPWDLSNAFLKFRKGHPILNHACRDMVRIN